ncbi:hypothetical protein HYS96_00795 [Candidatus Daviesbacteria bacterium]|nr:hypothetical protein [Candidatus Daviesbacteria bacterium]
MNYFFIALFLILTALFLPIPAYAASPAPGVDIKEYFGFGNIGSLGEGTTRLVEPAFQLTAAVVVIYFLLGAFKYLRAGGNKEELEGARQMIIHAIIGFIILMFAFLVLQFILSNLFKVTDFQIIG